MSNKQSPIFPEKIRLLPYGSILVGIEIVLVLLIMTGCDYQTIVGPDVELPPDQRDNYLLDNEPTIPPSWYGLTIGVSTKEEVLTVVQELNFVNPDSIGTRSGEYLGNEGELVLAACKLLRRDVCFSLALVDGKLVQIKSYPHFGMTFGQVVDHLGIPDFVSKIPDINGCDVHLVWLSFQITVSHNKEDVNDDLCSKISEGGQIPSELSIDTVIYDSADWFVEYFPRDFIDFPWSGFEK